MTKRDPKMGRRPRRRVRAGGLLVLFSGLVVGALTAFPASAELPPLLPPLPLPTVTPLDDLTTGGTVGTVGQLLGLVPEQLGPKPSVSKPVNPALPQVSTRVDARSLDQLPALQGSSARSAVSSTQLDTPGSYSSMVSGGLRAAAGRAANLAGPLAAPLAVALFAVGLLAVAARGPRRLVKVEEERQIFRDRRSYRL